MYMGVQAKSYRRTHCSSLINFLVSLTWTVSLNHDYFGTLEDT